MESFFLAETTKYLYLLFDTENFMHNQGNEGTVIETPNGQCVIETGGYIFNTEAHPIDASALHCCHDATKRRFFTNFNDFRAKRSLFRGEILEEKKTERTDEEIIEITQVEINGTVEQINAIGEVTTLELNDSKNVQLEKSSNNPYTIYVDPAIVEEAYVGNETGNNSLIINEEELFVEKFDPQRMLERIRNERKYYRNESWQENFKMMNCKAQPFLQRISIMGEFFNA